jgi:hypothetical protein
MDKEIEIKEKLTDRLLAISGDESLSGTIPIAKCLITIKTNHRIKLLKELIEDGCTDILIINKLSIEFGKESELELIEAEIGQLYRDGISFLL